MLNRLKGRKQNLTIRFMSSINIYDKRTKVKKIWIEKYGQNYALFYNTGGSGKNLAYTGVKDGSLNQVSSDRVIVTLNNGRKEEFIITSKEITNNTFKKSFIEEADKIEKKEAKKKQKKEKHSSNRSFFSSSDEEEEESDEWEAEEEEESDEWEVEEEEESDEREYDHDYYFRNGREEAHGPYTQDSLLRNSNVYPFKTEVSDNTHGPFEKISDDKTLLRKFMNANYARGKNCNPSGINKTLYGIIAMIFLPAFFFKCNRNDLSAIGFILFIVWVIALFSAATPYAGMFKLCLLIQIIFGIWVLLMPQNKFDYLFIYTKGNCK